MLFRDRDERKMTMLRRDFHINWKQGRLIGRLGGISIAERWRVIYEAIFGCDEDIFY